MLGKEYGKSYEYECATVWTQLVNRLVGIVQYGINYVYIIVHIYKMILPLYTVRKKNARKSPNYMPKYKKDKKNKNIFCKVKFFIAHSQSQGIPQS
jgi:hypothetical protein